MQEEETGVCKSLTTLLHPQCTGQDPSDFLREIVQCSDCYMDVENQINSAECSLERPMCTIVNPRSIRDEFEGKTEFSDETDGHQPNQDICNSSKNTGQLDKPRVETAMPSRNSARDVYVDFDHAETDNFVKKGASAKTVLDADALDCEITGMSVNTGSDETQNISAAVIAQIDFEIAKSLKTAFSNIGDFGLNNIVIDKVGHRGQNKSENVDKNGSKGKKPRQISAKEIIETDHGAKQTSETAKELEQNRATVLKQMNELNRLLQQKPVSLSVTDKHSQKTSKDSVADGQSSKHYGNGRADNSQTFNEDFPDKVKKENLPHNEDKPEDDVVWICFICAKGFADQSELMVHQDICEEEPSSLDSNQLKQDSLKTVISSAKHSASSSVSGSSSSVSDRRQLDTGCSLPVPTLLRKVGSSLKSLPLGLPSKKRDIKWRQKIKVEDIYIPPSRNIYFESLGLYPTPTVEEISKSPKKCFDDDCQIIDLTVDDAPQTHPMTPRTRSMLSQLSRDDSSGRRRQLSFSHNSQPSVSDKKLSEVKEVSEDSESSNEETVSQHKVPSKSAILGIPLTSPLGQRLKKHWKYESKVPIVDNIEMYCKTDIGSFLNEYKRERKNPFVEKLRNRPPPQCTFRFTKKYLNKWFHMYKFNKGDKKEFKKTLKFGLNRESRLKLKRMKLCRIVLSRIGEKDIKYWTTPRPRVVQKRTPESALLHQLNRQYRLNQIQQAMATSNAVRHMQRPLNQMIQPRFAGPTPQLLVRTVPMGGQGMRLQVLPIQQTQSQILFQPTNVIAAAPSDVSRSQKRKQVFHNVRQDDGMVICLSSDEEEEIVIKPLPKQQCAMCRINKDDCKLHGKRKIGPASFMRQQSINLETAGSTNVDIKPKTAVNIASKPVNVGQPMTYTTSASAMVFGQPPPQNVTLFHNAVSTIQPITVSDDASPIRPVNSGHGLINQDPNHIDQVKSETFDNTNTENELKSADNEYMDYEVICIDSDENDV